MSRTLDFYYDIASPYSYLAAARIDQLSEHVGVRVQWKPFLLGGVFRAVGNTMPAAVPARGRYLGKDLLRWAEKHQIPFCFSSSFPHNSLVAMRALTAASGDDVRSLSLALFRAAWVQDQDISNPDVVRAVLGSHGDGLVEAAQDPQVKERLKLTTQTAIDAGAFGAPTFLVGDELFWGNDRLDMAIEMAH